MLLHLLLADPFILVSSVLIGSLVALAFHVARFYLNFRQLPPGPFPLPFIGNLLAFFTKDHQQLPHEVILSFSKDHGPLFTFWTGPHPQVIITDAKIAKEALNKIEFAGRPEFGVWNDALFPKGSTDIVLSDFGREWEVLRKVSHVAARKFAVGERLPFIVDTKVKSFLREIQEQNGNNSFDIDKYLSFLMLSLLATSAFGKDFKMSDPEFKRLHESFKLQDEVRGKIILVSFMPLLKYIYRKEYKDLFETTKIQREYAMKQHKEHLDTYAGGTIRDFTDAMIAAKREAEAEDSTDCKYLKDENIINSVLDMFYAGSETTKMTLLWVFLFLAEYPEYQKAIRKEVETALGSDEIPTLEHRPGCNLLQAFILESMRIRPIMPLGVPHKTIVDTELAGHKIKKGVTVMISLQAASMDKELWGDPDFFRPERFLDANNKFTPKPNQFFVPFSGGRRVCLGEKLALTNSFLILAGLLHQTKGKLLALAGGPGSVDLFTFESVRIARETCAI